MKILADGGTSISLFVLPLHDARAVPRTCLIEAADRCEARSVQMLEFRTQGKDHPTPARHARRSLYLKCRRAARPRQRSEACMVIQLDRARRFSAAQQEADSSTDHLPQLVLAGRIQRREIVLHQRDA
ncbi:MAG: hypothetical protein MZU97_11255 [Bacillus subtilis]|nr:hypothetical protein [Bacillus subtilis]